MVFIIDNYEVEAFCSNEAFLARKHEIESFGEGESIDEFCYQIEGES